MMRYPVERTEYCKTVGRTRVENIAEILRSLDGFDVTIKKPEAHDVDIWVSKELHPIQVIEVLNWKRTAYLDLKRAFAIMENLNDSFYSDLNKLLVFSFWENIRNQMEFFDCLDIDFLEMGFQTQPIPYYVFYLSRGSTSDMRPNDEMTKEIVRRKLMAYLTEKNLI